MDQLAAQDSAPGEDTVTVELAVGGMHCASCSARVQNALSGHDGVLSASVNLATERAYVAFCPDETSIEELCESVRHSGYEADVVTPEHQPISKADPDRWALRAGVSWPLALGALCVAIWGGENVFAGWSVLLLAVAVEIAGGWPFIRNAARLAVHRALNMDTLIAVGTLAALAVSAVEAIALGGKHVHIGGGGSFAAQLHGVMGPLIVAILVTGRAAEARSRGRAASAMRALLSLRPPVARLVTSSGEEVLVAPESVPVGALVKVRAKEQVPLDGVVESGSSAVDESMLSGEPIPVDKVPGDFVIGGTTNGAGTLEVRVEAPASESVLSRLQKMVEDAQRDKAPLQALADRISSVFVPLVMAGAVVTFVLWWLAVGDVGKAVLSALAVVLVACPCAMGLAAPVAMMVGLGRASAFGILVRTSAALESLASATVVAFDKTGTLTEREATLSHVIVPGTVSPEEVVSVAAAAERDVEHPLAAAIKSAAAPSDARVESTEVLPGVGVRAEVDGHLVRVLRLGEQARELPPEVAAAAQARQAQGETVVVVEKDGDVLGALCIVTPLRTGARKAIDRLHAMGLRTMILSGDTGPAVAAVAHELGIDEAFGSLLPEDKLSLLRRMQADGHKTVMVGDGVNDAPALAAATVGCAIGSATEAALVTSDVLLLGNDLEGVPAAIAMARSTRSVIRQNFGWAMGYNLAALPLAALGFLDPLVAALAMGLSSIVVVSNSLRLLRMGRKGLGSVREPRALGAKRGVIASVLLPVVLFSAVTVVSQVVSPARGQSLLPTVPRLSLVSLPGGREGAIDLGPRQGAIDQFHLYFFEPDGADSHVSQVTVLASGADGSSRQLRLVRLGPGHFVAYPVLGPGKWTFFVKAVVDAKPMAFTASREA